MTNIKNHKFSLNGNLFVNYIDIYFDAVTMLFINGFQYARSKEISYVGINRWGGFKDGMCAISWILCPHDQNFAYSDGFGMEDNS